MIGIISLLYITLIFTIHMTSVIIQVILLDHPASSHYQDIISGRFSPPPITRNPYR